MMAKAHIAVGMAAAFTLARPETIPEALPVVTGAALGCLICDLDCESGRERSESSRYRILMVIAAAAALAEDHLLGAGMWRSLAARDPYIWSGGAAAFVLICAFASVSKHRGFAHSLLALALETFSLRLVFPAAAVPFTAAFVSHLVLDLLNKKPLRLLYPVKKGFCLGLFYADRLANKVMTAAGVLWLAVLILL
jgi:inner membrane protein